MKTIDRVEAVLAFQNEYGSLFNDIVKGPTGKIGRYLRWQWSGKGVVIIPVYRGQFVLRKMYRYSPGSISIEFPGGGVEDNEDLEAAAKRELMEEFGLVADTINILGEFNPDTAIMEDSIAVAEAIITDPSRYEINPEAFEAISDDGDLIWLNKDQLMKAISGGEIFSGTTISAALIYFSRSTSE